MNKLGVIKNIIGLLFLIVVIIVGAFVAITGNKEMLGKRALIVKSGSMEPTIKTGSLIFISPQSNYVKDNIVTFGPQTRPDQLVTHRIIDSEQKDNYTYFKTKGDANDQADRDLVPSTEVIGKLNFSLPYVGYVVSFAKTPLGAVVLIVIPGTLIIYDEFNNLKKSVAELRATRRHKPVEKDAEE